MDDRKMTVTVAARNFADVISRVYYRRESALLMKNKIPVARIVPVAPTECTAEALAAQWDRMSHLSPKEGADFAADLSAGRRKLQLRPPRWG